MWHIVEKANDHLLMLCTSRAHPPTFQHGESIFINLDRHLSCDIQLEMPVTTYWYYFSPVSPTTLSPWGALFKTYREPSCDIFGKACHHLLLLCISCASLRPALHTWGGDFLKKYIKTPHVTYGWRNLCTLIDVLQRQCLSLHFALPGAIFKFYQYPSCHISLESPVTIIHIMWLLFPLPSLRILSEVCSVRDFVIIRSGIIILFTILCNTCKS